MAHVHTSPTEICLYCAEKHLSTAWAWARERGYEEVNRQAIIGELVSTVDHLPWAEVELAEKIRDARHEIQDSHTKQPQVDWEGLMRDIDKLIRKAEEADKSKRNQREIKEESNERRSTDEEGRAGQEG